MRPATGAALLCGILLGIFLTQIDKRHRDAVDIQRDQINHCAKRERLLGNRS